MVHAISIFAKYQTGAIAGHCFEARRDFGKNIDICEISFHYYCPNIFSKLL